MELLNTCRDNAHKYYIDLLVSNEETLSQALFDYAERCTNSEDQGRYFDAVKLLKKNSKNMHSAFQKRLTADFQAFADNKLVGRSVNERIDPSNLSLVNRDELEDELAISVIISKSNSLNSEHLWKLNRRLAVLRGGKQITDETNPFGPALICEAIQIAITQLSLESKPKIFVYKQLGQALIPCFEKILTRLNEDLKDNAILPNLRFTVSRAALKEKQHPTNDSHIDQEPNDSITETSVSIAHQHELYNSIRQLQLQQTGTRTQTAGGIDFANVTADGSGGADSFSALDYALALSVIQQSKAFTSAAALNRPLQADSVEDKLFTQLGQQANKNARHKITNDDANTVDFVGMIFRFMLDDEKLNDAVKSMLSHLHTPYLKLALMDKNFLDNNDHPARQLLNSMTAVSIRWVKDDKDRKVLPKIKSTIKAILEDFVDDQSIFGILLEDFLVFNENLEKRAKMVEKRNTESQQGLERLEISKQRAASEMTNRLEQSNIPTNIGNLLEKTWADFLSFNLLRHGDNSQAWESALKVVDGVVWSVRPSKAAGSKIDFQRRQFALEKTVSEGLKTIGYDKDASATLLNSLREAHELAYHEAEKNKLEGARHTIKNVPDEHIEDSKKSVSSKEAISPKEPATMDILLTEDQRAMINKLQEIAFGTWFEFQNGENPYHLKLAWYSRVTSHYMFVDRDGIKQAVKTQIDLAKKLAAGEAQIVIPNNKSFMERAFEAVFEKLNLGVKN